MVSIIMYCFPLAVCASTMRLQSATVSAMGMVQATCLPASSPATHMSAWTGGGVLTWTTSMSRSRSSSA